MAMNLKTNSERYRWNANLKSLNLKFINNDTNQKAHYNHITVRMTGIIHVSQYPVPHVKQTYLMC